VELSEGRAGDAVCLSCVPPPACNDLEGFGNSGEPEGAERRMQWWAGNAAFDGLPPRPSPEYQEV
jgi:hypothetical protein